jgi:hypothetical protein
MAVKALVPAGYMISPAGERFLTVTICADASGTPKQMRIAIPDSDDDDAPTVCPFAAAAIADLPALASVSAPIVHHEVVLMLAPGEIIRARHHAATPPATGPPHLI